MYTQCPQCETLFRVTAQNLRLAMGMVRCTSCSEVFNALSTLRDENEIAVEDAQTVGSQLSFLEMGDRTVIHPKFLRSRDWYQEKAAGEEDVAEEAGPAAAPPAPPPEEQPAPAPRPRRAPAKKGRRAPAGSGFSLRSLFGENFTLAVRNLLRHRRRTALGLAAIGFGVIALLLAGGFIEWNTRSLREAVIHSQYGHVEVVKPGYLDKGVAKPFSYLLPSDPAAIKAIEKLPHVETVAPRLSFSGLISHGDATVSFLGLGVDPSKERLLSRDVAIAQGHNLDAGDPKGIILGSGLATSLAVKTGDQVVLLFTPPSGGMSAVQATVRGIFYTSKKAYDDVALRVPLQLAQHLTRVKGAQMWVILADRTGNTDRVLGELRAAFPESKTGFQYVPWYKRAHFYEKSVVFLSAQVDFVRVIIAAIILFSISNTLIMSVLERTAEIGTMMAIGYRRAKIMRLFVGEGFIIGLVGAVLGTTIGYGLAHLISHFGIPMPPWPGMSHGLTARILVTWQLALGAFALAVVCTVTASLSPAWKASRLEIVDALRHAK